jgi:hypothetical protein
MHRPDVTTFSSAGCASSRAGLGAQDVTEAASPKTIWVDDHGLPTTLAHAGWTPARVVQLSGEAQAFEWIEEADGAHGVVHE